MRSPTGIIPENLMYPERKREVIAWLSGQPLRGDDKANLLRGWAVTVGVRIQGRELRQVEDTGIDVP